MLNRNGASYKSLKREKTEDVEFSPSKFGTNVAAGDKNDELDFDLSDYNQED
jgi:hypothetical protein